MKKILCITLLLLTTIIFTSCDNDFTDNNHNHSFSAWDITKESTCTEHGIQTRRCTSCGFVEQSKIDLTSHTVVSDAPVLETCTADGKTAGSHCGVCGITIVQQNTVKAKGHTEVIDKAVDATCTNDGKTAGKHCAACNAVITAQTTISAKGHIEVIDHAIDGTCITDGKTAGSHCGVCGITIVQQNTVKAIGHNYDKGVIVTAASCIQNGTIKYTCTATNCEHSYTETYEFPIYTATEINNQAILYVGEIITYDKYGYEQSLGTGIVYDTDGKIITNYHVIDEAYSAKITINGIAYKIESVLAYDENIDLAVMKINATGLTVANVCKNPVQVGETVYAIGSSRGFTNTFSKGIITYADRVIDGISYVQHDASITHGNSGGPLINQHGEVIGINAWGKTDSQNLNFAIFSDELDNLVYGTPKTLAELYNENHSAYETLVEYICTYGTYDTEKQRYTIEYKNTSSDINNYYYDSYTLSYYIETSSIMVFNFYGETNWTVSTVFWLPSYAQGLYYRASYNEDNVGQNETYGFINPESFTTSTSTLPYDSYEGLADSEAMLMNLYSSCIMDMLDWVEHLLEADNINLTLADLGFVSYSCS